MAPILKASSLRLGSWCCPHAAQWVHPTLALPALHSAQMCSVAPTSPATWVGPAPSPVTEERGWASVAACQAHETGHDTCSEVRHTQTELVDVDGPQPMPRPISGLAPALLHV